MSISNILDMLNAGDFAGIMRAFRGGASADTAPPARGQASADKEARLRRLALMQKGLGTFVQQPQQQPQQPPMPSAPGQVRPVVSAYAQQPRPQGGVGLQSLIQPLRMAKGGLPNMNDRQLASDAIAAIQGRHPNPQVVLALYLKRHGPAKLRELVDKVRSGTPLVQDGKISGVGDGMSDDVPARGPGNSDIMTADGEYIVPADVVSGLGNGSTDAGARRLREMEAKVREARTGSAKQPPAMDPSEALPV